MDLVRLLENAAASLPQGEYSVGLNSIVRHVKAAIRHLDRDQDTDPDTYTDAIYRMNQAYEGSLKEAYRVLAGKDPSGLSPFQIEGYLESNSVVRPRVLVQLSRYRQDYRNPSAHDYKLDFDSDEALLAIVSVCGFAKLLIDQISSKLAANTALARIAEINVSQSLVSDTRVEAMARVCLNYTNESTQVSWFEFERGLAEALTAAGFDTELFLQQERRTAGSLWDIIVTDGERKYGIDAKVDRFGSPDELPIALDSYADYIENFNVAGAIVIIRSKGRSGFHLYDAKIPKNKLYVVLEKDDVQLEQLKTDYHSVSEVASIS